MPPLMPTPRLPSLRRASRIRFWCSADPGSPCSGSLPGSPHSRLCRRFLWKARDWKEPLRIFSGPELRMPRLCLCSKVSRWRCYERSVEAASQS